MVNEVIMKSDYGKIKLYFIVLRNCEIKAGIGNGMEYSNRNARTSICTCNMHILLLIYT